MGRKINVIDKFTPERKFKDYVLLQKLIEQLNTLVLLISSAI